MLTAAPTIDFDTLIRQGLEVRAGKTITLKATFSGVPKPTIKWMHQDETAVDITESKDHVMRVSILHNIVLCIFMLRTQYMCRACNKNINWTAMNYVCDF